MVRRRLQVIPLLLCAGVSVVSAREAAPETSDRKPYQIRALISFEPGTRIDASLRAEVVQDWLGLTRRFVGEPWSIGVIEGKSPLAGLDISDLKADALKPLVGPADKVWVIRSQASGSGLILEGRELDVQTGFLGEVHRQEVTHRVDLARGLLQLALAIFAPSAEVGESRGGGVSFLIRGGSLPAASPMGEVAPVGTVFRAIRIFLKPDGSAQELREIPYSYFRVRSLEGPTARCEIISGVGDPLTNRYARKNRIVALGIKPAKAPTRLRFLLRGDRQPAGGYRLIVRTIPPGTQPIEAGTTDREGRIVLPAGLADGLVSLRLVAGNNEPMLDVPIMPGESPQERTLIFEPKPQTLTLEARLEALRDAIIDVVAVRARLELRMKARLDGEDWDGLDETIAAFRKLTPRDRFQARLDEIRADGERQEAQLKKTVLTRNARAQLEETKNLIDRYLDDEIFRSYEDVASRARAEMAQAKAAKGKPPVKAATPPPK
ncbi:hypothetical protein P12x_003819 [Tundrisphaera lichenicola]|uniref:hypothetical protein n=1 Tax=Tundrisphaera lichenicola TaxID=2029860 RepID=UPI003EBB2DE4